MIYLDHAAATPVSEKVMRAMQRYYAEDFFNPSAAYLPATKVRKEYEAAKDMIAQVIGAKGVDLVMTSGATESINLAFRAAERRSVLISAIEHPAVLANAKVAAHYDEINVDKFGRVDLDDLRKKISPEIRLISVGLASGELGTIQPIAEIAEIVKAERQRRVSAGEGNPIYLHCDASQGLGLVEVKINRLNIDMLTLNAAKVYGPKGVGALWVAHHVKLTPVVFGGGQERALRGGTENVAGVVGFAVAMQEAEKHLSAEKKRIAKLREILKKVLSEDEAIVFLGNPKRQLVNFLPILIPVIDAERLIFKLEREDIYVSTGAACSASKGEKSRTLKAIGLSDEEIAGSLRISLGKLTSGDDMRVAGELILKAVREERDRLAGSNK
ncbi:MAG: cysteine desulfurase [Candidatus Nomurabacteria bacterium]|jgi:cysteine desulfurase|nr:cysteine desulfurase [Candidatus Nomurabacteria bacterium]